MGMNPLRVLVISATVSALLMAGKGVARADWQRQDFPGTTCRPDQPSMFSVVYDDEGVAPSKAPGIPSVSVRCPLSGDAPIDVSHVAIPAHEMPPAVRQDVVAVVAVYSLPNAASTVKCHVNSRSYFYQSPVVAGSGSLNWSRWHTEDSTSVAGNTTSPGYLFLPIPNSERYLVNGGISPSLGDVDPGTIWSGDLQNLQLACSLSANGTTFGSHLQSYSVIYTKP